MLTWHEKFLLLMMLEEKLNRLKERRQYFVAKKNSGNKLSQTQEEVLKMIEDEISEYETVYSKINDLKVIN